MLTASVTEELCSLNHGHKKKMGLVTGSTRAPVKRNENKLYGKVIMN